jgi:hypothetical protein
MFLFFVIVQGENKREKGVSYLLSECKSRAKQHRSILRYLTLGESVEPMLDMHILS